MAWQQRNHPKLHFLFYEDMKADIKTEVSKLNHFLGTNLTQQQLDNVSAEVVLKVLKVSLHYV